MRTPVIIAARNEAAYIGRTLEQLARANDRLEPLVVVNGTTDQTAEIARSYGARTLESPVEGKLPAIQYGLRHLGRAALNPVLLLDADSYPNRPSRWAQSMTRGLEPALPGVVAGPVAYTDTDFLSSSVRTAKRFVDAARRKHAGGSLPLGVNMALQLHTDELLEQVIDMPHYWPSEDSALKDIIVEYGGTERQSLRLGSYVVSSARYIMPLKERLALSGAEAHEKVVEGYMSRASAGSIPYQAPTL